MVVQVPNYTSDYEIGREMLVILGDLDTNYTFLTKIIFNSFFEQFTPRGIYRTEESAVRKIYKITLATFPNFRRP